jgi:hypothetical protein
VCVAVVELTPGVADSDEGFAVEDVFVEAFGAEPGAAGEVVVFVAVEPGLGAEFGGRHGASASDKLVTGYPATRRWPVGDN